MASSLKPIILKSSWLAESDFRLDASYHLSDGPLTILKLNKSPYKLSKLSEETEDIFKGNIFKRAYVSEKEFGYPFMTASDMMKSDISSSKYVSIKYTNTCNLILKEGWILVSRSGTLGNTVYTNKDFDNILGSDDLIRIVPNNKNIESGYLYAYLASRYGFGLLTQSGYGGVVQHIEPHHIEDIPIPILPKARREEIHNLIIKASKLRVEANKLLRDSLRYFERLEIDYDYGSLTTNSISIKGISQGYKRFDSAYAIVSKKVEDSIMKENIKYVTIKSQSNGIFIGPRSKRNYVKKGIPFLSTAFMQKANPTKTDKYLSIKSAKEFIVKKGWILTTRSGTIGDTIYTLPCLDGYAISEDAIRIVLKEKSPLSNEYLYTFLKSKIGISTLLSGSYGSVIQHLNEDYIGNIKVPLFETAIVKTIEKNIKDHIKFLNDAIIKENMAIDIIEKEIESWQKY